MLTTKQLGDFGEKIALSHLVKYGYQIIEKNWRYGKLEIDIIAQKSDIIAIVEVKMRENHDFGEPEDFVNRKKQGLLVKAANEFLQSRGIELEARFDIIAITGTNNTFIVKHIEGAFFPVVK